ncbi:MAG: serine/threonine protein kinase [Bacteroidia bacterium]|nr:serine/threonine protein kinase [Bacteroidia bacterium]
MTVGEYNIIQELASGGMGKVYIGQHVHLGGLAVIKTLLPEYAQNEVLVRRFYTEARIMAELDHPAIVKLYDFSIQDGMPYLVMEYVHGRSLEEVLNAQSGNPLGIDWVMANLSSIFDALGYIHRKDIIHRDIKPSNIIILPEGGSKLLDFGIAKAMDADYKLTQTGTHIGTALYMAPEQVADGAVSPQTDLFAMGLIIYQCLFGRYPWAWEGKTLFQIYQTILTERPPIPAEAPEIVHFFFDKALAKSPKERFSSAEAMLTGLREIQAHFTPQRGPTPQVEVKALFEDVLTDFFHLPEAVSSDQTPEVLRAATQSSENRHRIPFPTGILSIAVGIAVAYFLHSPLGIVGWISWTGLIGGLLYTLLGQNAVLRPFSYLSVGVFGGFLAYFHLFAFPKFKAAYDAQINIYSALLTETEGYRSDSLSPLVRRRLRVKGIDPQDIQIEIEPLPEPPSFTDRELSLREIVRVLRGKVQEIYPLRKELVLNSTISYKKNAAVRYSQEVSCTASCGFFGLSTCYGTQTVWFLATWKESCTMRGKLVISYDYDTNTQKLRRRITPRFDYNPKCEEIPGTRTKRVEFQGACLY